MKVEDLSQFGKPLGMPKKAQRKMLGIVLTALREKFGLMGIAPVFVKLLALLRICVAADSGAGSRVELRRVRVDRARVQLTLGGKDLTGLEALAIEQRKDLFERIFGRELAVRA